MYGAVSFSMRAQFIFIIIIIIIIILYYNHVWGVLSYFNTLLDCKMCW